VPPIWRATCGSRSGPRMRIATTPMIKTFPGSRLSTGLGRKSGSARLDSGLHSSYSDWVTVRMSEPSDHDAIDRQQWRPCSLDSSDETLHWEPERALLSASPHSRLNFNLNIRHPRDGMAPERRYTTETLGVGRISDGPRSEWPTSMRSKGATMLAEIFGMDGIVVVVLLAVVLFGGAAIPKLARSLGSAKNQFEKGLDEGKNASPVVTAASNVASSNTPMPFTQ